MACLLQSFSNPKLNNPLPGLRIDEQGDLSLIRPLFACCHGEGLCYDHTRDSYQRCQLNERFQRLAKLCDLFQNTWGSHLQGSHLKVSTPYQTFHHWLPQYLSKTARLGHAFTSVSSENKPSYTLWLMALSSVWKAGCEVHVVSLGKTKADKLLPVRDFASKKPGIVFIEQKDPLWRPQTAFDFDTLINWCEGAMLPVWIDFLHTAPATDASFPQDTLNLKLAFAHKINKIQQRPMLSWMGADCWSRLKSVCAGSEEFM